ncbi:E3 sumo-protein ligase ranbp2-like [Plakobranchus ocellatus]|uniref:E3 sumo-protein ligase ranbp2-like n=1 Tax=Plakobranchus ocellatus TaxID=259542 RepID=A0AAV3ZNJ5_9GAST|nr:E3 sumo-protein ligase ranbp2-like [Plakobranchus ocellatus]
MVCNNAMDVAADDLIVPSTYKVLQEQRIPKLDFGDSMAEACATKSYHNEKNVTIADIMTSATFSHQGDKGNPYMTQALDVAGVDTMTSASYTHQGDKGNPYMTQAWDVAGVDKMTSASYTQQGDKGNPYMTQALDVAGVDTMTSASYSQQGDKRNPYMTQALDVAGVDTMTSASYSQQGDKGNPYMTQALDVAGVDTMTSASYSQQGDKGNPYMTQASNVSLTRTIKLSPSPPKADTDNRYSCKTMSVEGSYTVKLAESSAETDQEIMFGEEGAPNQPDQATVSQEEDEQDDVEDDEEDYEDDDEDEEDEDEEEEIVFDKRATLSLFEDGKWKNQGMGSLSVSYIEDINGYSIHFKSDSGDKLCNHVITRELLVSCNIKNKSCEWQPIDYSTDEPVRRHFAASFSSAPACNEFKEIFEKGHQLAVESDLSEKLPSEIEVPEVFSMGEPGH